AFAAALVVEVVFNFDYGRDGVAGLTEKLEAHGARVLRHAVQYPTHRGDQAIAAFFLHPGQTGQELVGHVLAQPLLAESPAFDSERFSTQQARTRSMSAIEPLNVEARVVDIVDLAHIVTDPGDFKPVPVRVDHAPPSQVIQRGAP